MWKVQFGPQKRILFSAKLKNCVVDKTEDPQLLLELTTDDQSEKLRASFALSGDQVRKKIIIISLCLVKTCLLKFASD